MTVDFIKLMSNVSIQSIVSLRNMTSSPDRLIYVSMKEFDLVNAGILRILKNQYPPNSSYDMELTNPFLRHVGAEYSDYEYPSHDKFESNSIVEQKYTDSLQVQNKRSNFRLVGGTEVSEERIERDEKNFQEEVSPDSVANTDIISEKLGSIPFAIALNGNVPLFYGKMSQSGIELSDYLKTKTIEQIITEIRNGTSPDKSP